MTIKTITLAKASKQLGVPEEQLRQSIKPLYPETWETIKSIKIAEFEVLAEALRDLAEPETEAIEQDASVDEVQPSEPQSSELVQSSEQPEQSTTLSEESETSLETTTTEDTDIILAESSDLVPEQAEQLKIATIQTFSNFALDLNQITQALAYSTALKNFANFKEIHSATFRHHAERYVEDFGQEYKQMLLDLEEKCNPSDFLQQRGITTASTKG